MSVHIGANKGDIAEAVLLPGDPLRAKYIAENFLDDIKCYNEVRGMLGFTGYYKGTRVSVQGTGMGIPSLAIYVNELIDSYDVKNVIRVGSCGSYMKEVKIRDVILAMTSSTDSSFNKNIFRGQDFAPCASWELLNKAYRASEELEIPVKVGNVFSTDNFYGDIENYKLWASHGVLAAEMETSGLYSIAARKGVNALSILTVSDSLVTGESTSSEEREKSFNQMMEIALRLA